ncbi:hypothetical protein ACQPYK_33885 [Streptosporangium sp. CA-135522]|uniref:hypothetical protein n=1 Tax=Streptosporangium sp. CA-135522 TaxID=3240072 RepID=UPI003D90CB2A
MTDHDQEKIGHRSSCRQQSQAKESAMDRGRHGASHQICDAMTPESREQDPSPEMQIIATSASALHFNHTAMTPDRGLWQFGWQYREILVGCAKKSGD